MNALSSPKAKAPSAALMPLSVAKATMCDSMKPVVVTPQTTKAKVSAQ